MNPDQFNFVSEEQAECIFSDIFSFFGTLSLEGKVLNLFGKVFEKADVDPQVLVGQVFAETVFWQASEYTSAQLIAAIEEATGGKTTQTQLEFRVSATEQIIVELHIYPLSEAGNQITRLFFCASEVTSREKEIAHYREKSEHLLYAAENAEVGLWHWDLVNNIIDSTPRCNELFEISPHEPMTFDAFLTKLHPDDRAFVESDFTESQKYGKEYHSDFRVISQNGKIDWISSRGKSFLNEVGEPKNMMGTFQAVSDKKLAFEQLTKVYEIEKRGRIEAEDANRAKDFFLAVISHELRSPLNAILGWTKILLQKELDVDTHRKALTTIEKSARSQAKLLDDLMDSTRVASGRIKLEFREINLVDVITTVNNLQKPAADAKNIEVKISSESDDIKVFGDSNRLQQVISNLLSNALKFTPEGGTIAIETSIKDEEVTIKFKDSGQGIATGTLPKIFRQFRQGDEEAGDKGGLGLGLSISKILVEKHNGTIKAESDGIGEGSTFTVKLPLLAFRNGAMNSHEESKTKESKLLSGTKILIVEDEPDSREVLQLFLEQNGAEVWSAEIAADALTYLGESIEKLPDIILSDLAMPGMDGYTMLNKIRSFAPENGGQIPAVALSAFSSMDNKHKAFQSGFQKYHTKPFEPDGIIQDILQLVKK